MSCPPDKIITDYANGIVVCTEDGSVLDIVYDYSQPRVYDSDGTAKLVNSPLNPVFHDFGLHTDIDDYDRADSIEQINKAKKLKSLNNKLRFNSAAKKHMSVISAAREILSQLGASFLLPEVASVMRQVNHKANISCKCNRTLAAALVYFVCRLRGVPRTLKDITNATGLKKDEIAKCYRAIITKLDVRPQPYSPSNFISRATSLLNLPGEFAVAATSIATFVHDKCYGFQGNDPHGIAAGTLYTVALMKGKHIPQEEIARVLGVSEATVRARYREIATCLEKHGIHVPEPP